MARTGPGARPSAGPGKGTGELPEEMHIRHRRMKLAFIRCVIL